MRAGYDRQQPRHVVRPPRDAAPPLTSAASRRSLWYNSTHHCVGLEDATCSDQCASARASAGANGGEGCMITARQTSSGNDTYA